MNIVYKSIDELKEYENNPRKNDKAVEYVKNSIEQFGFKTPIVVDRNNVIVSGHTRYKAAKELEMNEVPCIVSELDDKDNNLFRIVDNKSKEKAYWNFDILDKELDDIKNINIADFGFIPADMNWDDVPGLEEYEEPEKKYHTCPECGFRDVATHFKKIERK